MTRTYSGRLFRIHGLGTAVTEDIGIFKADIGQPIGVKPVAIIVIPTAAVRGQLCRAEAFNF